MRHKEIIIILAVLLVFLLVVKASQNHRENTTYPLVIDYYEAYDHKDDYSLKKVNFAIKDRVNNTCVNPLFFCGSNVKLGMTREEFKAAKVDEHAIYLNNTFVPCSTIYEFDKNDQLCAVYVRIANGNFVSAPDVVLSTFGNKRIDIISSTEASKHIWYFSDFYIHLDKEFYRSDKKTYITVSKYSAIERYKPYQLCFYGGGHDYLFDDANRSSSSSSTRTYKYGDSDIYQGSSQQKADLEAIDKYFGF